MITNKMALGLVDGAKENKHFKGLQGTEIPITAKPELLLLMENFMAAGAKSLPPILPLY